MKEGNQCWCGNALGGFSSRVVDMSCHLPCSGNNGQTCGGPNRMSTYSVGDANIAKRDSAAAPMRFAETSARLEAMAEKNWRPRTEDLTKDSPAPPEGVPQEDAVTDVTPSEELSGEEQQLEDGSSGEQLLTSSGNATDATEAPSWAADAAAAAASWQAEHPETNTTISL
jgi:hypothetical protein